MFHQGFADALAKVVVADRVGALERRPPRFRPRESGSDASLSLLGAAALLVLVLFGPGGAIVVGLVSVAAIWPLRDLVERRPQERKPAPELGDRWQVWRVHEPDAGYLRRGGAA